MLEGTAVALLSPIHEHSVSAYEGFVSEALSSPSLSFLVSDPCEWSHRRGWRSRHTSNVFSRLLGFSLETVQYFRELVLNRQS